MAWLRHLLLLLYYTQVIHSHVYSCEEVRYRIINPVFLYENDDTFLCVITQQNFQDWSALSQIKAQTDTLTESFENIAKSQTGCISKPAGARAWTVVGTDTMDCSAEFSLIYTNEQPSFGFPIDEVRSYTVQSERKVLVVPQVNMWLHSLSCTGEGNVTVYTGAGSSEYEQRYELRSWRCADVPAWIFLFDNVITVEATPSVAYSFECSSNMGSRSNPPTVSPGDRIALLASGRSDNLQAKGKPGGYVARVAFANSQIAKVAISLRLTFDHTRGDASVSAVTLKENHDATAVSFRDGWHERIFNTDYFEVEYKPTLRNPGDIWSCQDTINIDILTSVQDESKTTGATTTRPSKTTATTRTSTRPISTTTPAKHVGQDPYCNCAVDKFGFASGWNYNDIWLDIVIILDTSEAMGTEGLEDAGALIESLISDGFDDFLITDTTAPLYTRVGVISMADTAEVLYNLNMTKADKIQGTVSVKKGVTSINIEDAFQAALNMFNDGLKSRPNRNDTRHVVFYMTGSDPDGNLNALSQFKTSNGVIIVNDFLEEGEVELPGLKSMASEGYYFVNSNYMQGLQAFCKANCFCHGDKDTYGGSDPMVKAAGGCYHPSIAGVPFNKAQNTCSLDGGIVAVDHDEEKGQFLRGLMTKISSKSDYFWIGYTKSDDGVWKWEDQSTDPYTNWDTNEPSSAAVAKCAYVDTTSSSLAWGAGNCQLGFPYICEYTPCSVGNKDC